MTLATPRAIPTGDGRGVLGTRSAWHRQGETSNAARCPYAWDDRCVLGSVSGEPPD